jgi:hypothetical protein
VYRFQIFNIRRLHFFNLRSLSTLKMFNVANGPGALVQRPLLALFIPFVPADGSSGAD